MMKIDKKKVVFGSILICVLVFILSYSLMIFRSDKEQEQEVLSDPEVPQLKEESEFYNSRLEAINDLQEQKPSLAPSLYDEIEEEQQEWSEAQNRILADSIPEKETWTMDSWSFNREDAKDSVSGALPEKQQIVPAESAASKTEGTSAVELALAQELFFSSTTVHQTLMSGKTDAVIHVFVDGQQLVRANSRLRMRLSQDTWIGGEYLQRLKPVYGFVSFRPNRVMLSITQVMHLPVSLKAYDIQDGSEGIYVENNFRAEASRETLDDVLGEINIPTVPQVGGLTRLFQKHNRNIKVSITDRYQLLLKPEL
ncbi:conjugative transposon protein TraM [Autumnicola musiva]|uniref:Conjugative transposon protein TraM n=1 Tax=Autumnicola musiva TaxID=3075589 RepID=A0ABU3D8Q7_9FLAO|nr:conjugative transposon protein TraM [Zunongwangia sp. F117]MDT0677917.1 conjugative transposon protein TraM [Zunongwangia sp. F117]